MAGWASRTQLAKGVTQPSTTVTPAVGISKVTDGNGFYAFSSKLNPFQKAQKHRD